MSSQEAPAGVGSWDKAKSRWKGVKRGRAVCFTGDGHGGGDATTVVCCRVVGETVELDLEELRET